MYFAIQNSLKISENMCEKLVKYLRASYGQNLNHEIILCTVGLRTSQFISYENLHQ